MSNPIKGSFVAPDTFIIESSQRQIPKCEQGLWAAVKHLFGQNVQILVCRKDGTNRQTVYVPLSVVQKHVTGVGLRFEQARGIGEIFRSVLNGKYHEAPAQLGQGEIHLLPEDEAVLLKHLKKDGRVWFAVPAYLKEDQLFLAKAVGGNPDLLERLPERFQKDQNFLLMAIRENSQVFEMLPTEIQEDRAFLALAVNATPALSEILPLEVLGDVVAANPDVSMKLSRECLADVVAANPDIFMKLPEDIQGNEEFRLKAIAANPDIFKMLPEGIQGNEEFRLKAIAANPDIFKMLPEATQENEEFRLKAIGKASQVFEMLPKDIREKGENRGFVAKAIEANFEVLKILLSDAQIVMGDVPKNAQVSPKFQLAATFKSDHNGNVQIMFYNKKGWAVSSVLVPKEKVQRCIEEVGLKFDMRSDFVKIFASVLRGQYRAAAAVPGQAGVRLSRDYEGQLLDELRQDIRTWNAVPDYLQNDRGFLEQAVAANPTLLEQINVPQDKDFFLNVLMQNCNAFQFLPVKFKQDLEFWSEALKRNAHVLTFLSFEGLDNVKKRQFLLEVVKANPYVYTEKSFPQEFKGDPEFKEACKKSNAAEH
jgi:hypothetical protein